MASSPPNGRTTVENLSRRGSPHPCPLPKERSGHNTESSAPETSLLLSTEGRRSGEISQRLSLLAKPGAVLFAILLIFGLLLYFIPMRTTVQIGADEGFEMAKATLLPESDSSVGHTDGQQ